MYLLLESRSMNREKVVSFAAVRGRVMASVTWFPLRPSDRVAASMFRLICSGIRMFTMLPVKRAGASSALDGVHENCPCVARSRSKE